MTVIGQTQRYLIIVTPKQLSPDVIEARYGLECEGDPNEGKVRHYNLHIRYSSSGLLNNRFNVEDKRDFFAEIARNR